MRTLHLTLPRHWGQLTEKQLIYFSRLLLAKVPEPELLARCFMKFSGLFLIQHNPKIVKERDRDVLCYEYTKKGEGKSLIDVDTFTDLVSRLDWMVEGVKIFHNIAQIKRYHGCNYKLFDITLEQYLIADNMYLAYAKTNDLQYLNRMVAVFYRKRSDKWQEGEHLTAWAKRFAKVDMAVKYSVFLWFTGVKSWLIIKYPNIFSGPGGEVSSPTDSIMCILSALSEGDVTKNAEIKRTNVHEALDVLNKKLQPK